MFGVVLIGGAVIRRSLGYMDLFPKSVRSVIVKKGNKCEHVHVLLICLQLYPICLFLLLANFRLSNFALSVSDDNMVYTDCASYPGGDFPNPRVTLSCETTGRYVRFQRVGDSSEDENDLYLVTLCEVVIIGYKISSTLNMSLIFFNARLCEDKSFKRFLQSLKFEDIHGSNIYKDYIKVFKKLNLNLKSNFNILISSLNMSVE